MHDLSILMLMVALLQCFYLVCLFFCYVRPAEEDCRTNFQKAGLVEEDYTSSARQADYEFGEGFEFGVLDGF